MTKKSKNQKAKASAARQARKELAKSEAKAPTLIVEQPEEKKSGIKGFFSKEEKPEAKVKPKAEPVKKKKRFPFFSDVRSEMKRVTWPTRKDVLQWSGVVVGALLFFGLLVALLDNVVITPLLVGISSLGA